MSSGGKIGFERILFASKRFLLRGLKFNIFALFADLVILGVYTLLKTTPIQFILLEGLPFLLLLDSGIFFFAAGAYVITASISFGKMREQIFHSNGWSPEEYRRSEVAALPWIASGIFTLLESIVLSILVS